MFGANAPLPAEECLFSLKNHMAECERVCVCSHFGGKKKEEKLAQVMGCISDQHSVGKTEWFDARKRKAKYVFGSTFKYLRFGKTEIVSARSSGKTHCGCVGFGAILLLLLLLFAKLLLWLVYFVMEMVRNQRTAVWKAFEGEELVAVDNMNFVRVYLAPTTAAMCVCVGEWMRINCNGMETRCELHHKQS